MARDFLKKRELDNMEILFLLGNCASKMIYQLTRPGCTIFQLSPVEYRCVKLGPGVSNLSDPMRTCTPQGESERPMLSLVYYMQY